MKEKIEPSEHRTPSGMTRRDFVTRLAGASLIGLGLSGIGLALRDPVGPAAFETQTVLSGLGDFTINDLPDRAERMAIATGTDRAAMLGLALKAMGGVEAYVRKGDRVLIKVNAAFATPAALGATTHPDLLSAMVELCFKAGAARVLVTDNPINNPESCFAITGLAEAVTRSGAVAILPHKDLFRPATLKEGQLIRNWPVMSGAFEGINKFIVMSPVKDHHRAGASMILKNYYGLLGGQRNIFHQNINGIIAELALLVKPTLAILDGTVAMMSNGPTGGALSDLKSTGTLIVSTDPVAADAAGLELLDRSPDDVPYIAMAESAGAGIADYDRLNPARLEVES